MKDNQPWQKAHPLSAVHFEDIKRVSPAVVVAVVGAMA